MRKIFNGVLTYDDNGDYMIGEENLCEYLARDVQLRNDMSVVINSNESGETVASGQLKVGYDKYLVIDWFVGSFPLGLWLFEHTGEDMNIVITTNDKGMES